MCGHPGHVVIWAPKVASLDLSRGTRNLDFYVKSPDFREFLFLKQNKTTILCGAELAVPVYKLSFQVHN